MERPVRMKTPCKAARSSRKTDTTGSRESTSCERCEVSTPASPVVFTCISAREKNALSTIRPFLEFHVADNQTLDAKMARVEQLVHSLRNCPDPVVRDQVQELIATLMDFHGEGLSRMFHILEAHAGNLQEGFNAICNDPLVG